VLLHPIFLRAAAADHETELLEVRHPVEVHESTSHYKDVKQLMGVELRKRKHFCSDGVLWLLVPPCLQKSHTFS